MHRKAVTNRRVPSHGPGVERPRMPDESKSLAAGSRLISPVGSVNLAATRMLVLSNPSAGARPRQAIRQLAAGLAERGLEPEVLSDLTAFQERTVQYAEAGQLRAAVAAGGDGTVAEIVNRSAAEVPVTVYPCGTANLLATHFGIACEPATLAEMLVDGVTLRLDVGRANGRIFLLMAGCGFDAHVVDRLHRVRRGTHISYWSYAKPILQTIAGYRYPKLRVFCDPVAGEGLSEVAHAARWAFVVNLPCYAGGLRFAPRAVATDGKLDVATFAKGSLWHGLRYMGYLLAGRLDRFRTTGTCR